MVGRYNGLAMAVFEHDGRTHDSFLSPSPGRRPCTRSPFGQTPPRRPRYLGYYSTAPKFKNQYSKKSQIQRVREFQASSLRGKPYEGHLPWTRLSEEEVMKEETMIAKENSDAGICPPIDLVGFETRGVVLQSLGISLRPNIVRKLGLAH